MKILIKNGRVIDPKNNVDGFYDVLIKDNFIEKIGKNLENKDYLLVDANNKIVCPGFVDAHVHFRIPGLEYKEDLISGTKAALKGGITSAAAMPNTKPVIDSLDILKENKKEISKKALIDVYPIVSVTKGQNGEELVDFESMKDDTVAFSDDGMPIMNEEVLDKAFKNLPNESVIISHCEDFNISKKYLNEPWPCIAESNMVKRNLSVAKKYNKRIHIAHISCEDSLKHIIDARKNNTKVTCEVTPHHFSISYEDIDIKDTYSKVNPPIRSLNNKNAIVEGIKNNHIDIIATDHAPHDIKSKNIEYSKASFGISGIETSFSLAYTNLVRKEKIELSKIIGMMTYKPAELLGINRGTISKGDVADLVIIDLEKKNKISTNEFESKGKNSPFDGYEVCGEIDITIKDGRIRYMKGGNYEY